MTPEKITLGQSVLIWAAAVLVLSVVARVAPGATGVVYLIAGVVLSRLVLNRLFRWHWMYNDIGSVAAGKLKLIALWPIGYPVLFFQYFIANRL